LLTEPALNPKDFRERTAEVWFELFNIPALFLGVGSVLSLYALGWTTGMVLDIGEGVTNCVPIYNGFAVRQGLGQLAVAGNELTEYLMRLLHTERGRSFHEPICGIPGYDITKDIKEKLCYVCLDPEEEATIARKKELDRTYKLPNGDTITLGGERFGCTESLFDPSKVGQERGGVHLRIFESIQELEVDIRRPMYENILLAGGSSRFAGLGERIEKELKKLAPPAVKIRLLNSLPEERQWLAWTGGSLFASFATFPETCCSKEEYEETGSSVIKRTTQVH